MNNKDKKKRSLVEIVGTLTIAAVAGWLIVGTQSNISEAGQSNFMGGAPSVEDSDDVNVLRLLFPAGVRSNWHSHSWGQLLMIEEGKGLTQDRGGPIVEMGPGEPWFTPAGVEHWHGAAPDEDAHQLTIYAGDVNWLEGVGDLQYSQTPKR